MESFLLLSAHCTGDFLLQNDWMAKGKKQWWLPCAAHCAIYTSCIAMATGWPIWALAVTFIMHFIQDRTQIIKWYMLKMGQGQFAQPPMAPWSMVAVDNSFHFLVLSLTWVAVEML